MPYDTDRADSIEAELRRETPFDYKRKFTPVVVRNRHDGWSDDRQAAFIAALGESGCVADACRSVGMSTEGAYKLRARPDAIDFRLAWEAALDFAVDRLDHAVLSRAINGVAVPHFYQGKQVGEHRRYDERLALFLLRYRKPLSYARHWDRRPVTGGHPEELAERFAAGLATVRADHSRDELDRDHLDRMRWEAERAERDAAVYAATPDHDPGEAMLRDAEADMLAREADDLADAILARMRPDIDAYLRRLCGDDAGAADGAAATDGAAGERGGSVPRTSSTSDAANDGAAWDVATPGDAPGGGEAGRDGDDETAAWERLVDAKRGDVAWQTLILTCDLTRAELLAMAADEDAAAGGAPIEYKSLMPPRSARPAREQPAQRRDEGERLVDHDVVLGVRDGDRR